MVRTKVVLGDNKTINLQNAVASTMSALRRSVNSLASTTLTTNRCISCKTPQADLFDVANILRCSALQDNFMLLCAECADK